MRILFQVRGTSFRPASAKAVAAALQPGEIVQLDPEPTNPYDPSAVRVIARGEFIGYVQKELSADVTELLGGPTIATVYSTIGAPMIELKTDVAIREEKRIATAAGN